MLYSFNRDANEAETSADRLSRTDYGRRLVHPPVTLGQHNLLSDSLAIGAETFPVDTRKAAKFHGDPLAGIGDRAPADPLILSDAAADCYIDSTVGHVPFAQWLEAEEIAEAREDQTDRELDTLLADLDTIASYRERCAS